MKSYIYKIILNNNKSYIGLKISKTFNEYYMGSSANKQFWNDLKNIGMRDHIILEELEYTTKSQIIPVESKYIKENGIWPDSYNFSYFDNGKLVNSLEKYELMNSDDYKEYKKLYDKSRYEKNKEKIKNNVKRYRDSNKCNISKKKKEYRKRNIDTILEYDKKYKEIHKEEILLKNQEYKKKNYDTILKQNRDHQRKIRNKNMTEN